MGLSENLQDLPAWTIVIAALFAPFAVWVLWRLQILAVELLRARLVRLLRWAKWVYNIVSWFGTFLHEVSHATVLLFSGHGIKEFRVRTDSGHVLPKRVRKGPVGFLFFLVAALAPLFGPPLLALVGLVFLVDRDLMPFASAELGLAPAVGVLEQIFVEFPWQLLQAVGQLDLSKPWHIAAFAVILVGIPGSRPSHVKGSRFHGEDDEGDIAVVRKRLRKNPWPLLGFLVVLLAGYYPLVKWVPAVYWYPFEAIWAVAITAIVLSIAGALWWSCVAWNTGTKVYAIWLAPAALIALQIAGHGPLEWSVGMTNAISFGAYAVFAIALRLVLPRQIGARLGL